VETNQLTRVGPLTIPSFTDIPEPQMVVLVANGRAGTKIFQSYLDSHENLLMIPGCPLMYLYPHWGTWSQQFSGTLSWEQVIDLFCEKHGSVLDSRRVPGLSGLERLGEGGDEHVEVDEQAFRSCLDVMLRDQPVSRRTFLLAVHYAYGLCKGWDLESKPVLFLHLHYSPYLRELSQDFPGLKVLNMMRNPVPTLSSTLRVNENAGQAKLNPTDNSVYLGRNFRLSCHFQFEILDGLGSYLDDSNVVSVKLESLHRQHETTMRSVADWLGVDFSHALLESTFDGKLWWGDFTNTVPVNGLDPQALSEKWQESVGRIDAFVIEGVLAHLYNRYGYDQTEYRRDNWLNRLLLVLAILLPSKAERTTLRFYFNPLTHLRFLRAAFDESTGRQPRKDYTWNGSYLYKYWYTDLKLWRSRWHHRLLSFAESFRRDGGRLPVGQAMLVASQAVYISAQYGRLWFAILTYPREIFRRWRICFGSLQRRLGGRSFLPPLLR